MMLIDIWKSGHRILAPISEYGSTHTIIENGTQSWFVPAAWTQWRESSIDTVKDDMLPLGPPASAATTDICHA